LWDFFTDVTVLLAQFFNVVGFWRYRMLYNRQQRKILTRMDLIMNPIYTIMDIPWLLLCILCLVGAPHRFFFTFLKLTAKITHFKDDQNAVICYKHILVSIIQGLMDYIHLPLYLIALLHPYHIGQVVTKIILGIGVPDVDYKDFYGVNSREHNRRKVVRLLARKTIYDTWVYFLLFPLSILTL
jgi:hypothetical protein